MYTRGRFLSRISPYGLMEEPPVGRRRGFILRGQALSNDGAETILISKRLSEDWYHLRFLTFFDDPNVVQESDNRLIIRANGSPLGEFYTVLILPYIGKRHLIDVRDVAPPLSLFEVLYLNNGGVNHTPELVITGFRSHSADELDAEGP